MSKESIQDYIEANYDELQEEYRKTLGITEEEAENMDDYFDEDKFYTWAEEQANNHEADKIDRLRDERKEL